MKILKKVYIKFRNFKNRWKPPFKEVHIPSSIDGKKQTAYIYTAKSKNKRPLIVSLHSWASTYKIPDPGLSKTALENDWNYIHPDFRGVNDNPESVGSELAMSDINDAIKYSIDKGNVDFDNVFIVGGSGGAYATLCFYAATKYKINSYIAWSPITDLIAWHDQSVVRKDRYVKDIMTATKSVDQLDVEETKKRSPLYRDFPESDSNFYLFSGYHDGADQGPVPLSHTLDFYNKFAQKNGADESDLFSQEDYINLSIRESLPTKEEINGRSIISYRKFKKISATIYDGGHEHLGNHSIKLIKDNIKY